MITSKCKAIVLLKNLLLDEKSSHNFTPVQYSFPENNTLKRLHSKNKEILLIFHGLNGCGNNDKRIIRLANAMAKIGFDVYLPNIATSANHEILDNGHERMANFLRNCFKYFNQQFSVVAPSFDAYSCMASLAFSDIRKSVKSICSIGGIYDLEYFLQSKHSHQTVQLIMLKNYLLRTQQLSPQLQTVINLLLKNLQVMNEKQNCNFDGLTKVEKGYFSQKYYEIAAKYLYEKNKTLTYVTLKELSPVITTPISIIHGSNDKCISPNHAIELGKLLNKDSHKLCLTSLLTHGDTQKNWKLMYEINNLIRAFSFFIEKSFN